jgi:hypothetical protein
VVTTFICSRLASRIEAFCTYEGFLLVRIHIHGVGLGFRSAFDCLAGTTYPGRRPNARKVGSMCTLHALEIGRGCIMDGKSASQTQSKARRLKGCLYSVSWTVMILAVDRIESGDRTLGCCWGREHRACSPLVWKQF